MRLYFIAAVLIAAARSTGAQASTTQVFEPGPFDWNVAPPGSYRLAYTSDSESPRVAMTFNSVRNEVLVVFPAQPNQHYYMFPGSTGIVAQRINAATGAPIGSLLSLYRSTDLQAWMDVPSVVHAAGPDRYMVAFRDDYYGHLLGLVLNGDGSLLTPAPFSLDDNQSEEPWADAIGLTYDSVHSTFVAAWDIDETFGSGLFVRRYGIDGKPAGAIAQVEVGVDAPWPGMLSLAYLGGSVDRVLIAYALQAYTWGGVPKAPTIVARLLAPDNTMTAAVTLSAPADTARWKIWPRAVANPVDREWLVAWEETDADSYAGKAGEIGDIAFRRVGADGVPAGPSPVTLEGGPEADYAPAVAWSPVEDCYVVAWQRGAYGPEGDVYCRSIAGGSDLVDGKLRPIVTDPVGGATAPCIAASSSASEIFVTWLQDDASIKGLRSDISIAPPGLPGNLAQFRSDGVTALPPRGIVRDDVFVAAATLTQAEGTFLSLQVELQPAGAPFTGVSTATSAVSARPGSVATVRVASLSGQRAWHWQCRAVDRAGRSSPWVAIATNPVAGQGDFTTQDNGLPASQAPSLLDAASGRPIGNGGTAMQRPGIEFRARVDDPDADYVRLEVELRPVGAPFAGVATAMSTFATSGSVAALTAVAPEGELDWRYRAVDNLGAAGPWLDGNTTVVVMATGSGGPSSCLQSAGARLGLVVLAMLVLVFRR